MCCLTREGQRKAMEYIEREIGDKMVGMLTLRELLIQENIISHDVNEDQVYMIYKNTMVDMGLSRWN